MLVKCVVILGCLLGTAHALALNFSMERSTPTGFDKVELVFESDRARLYKTSNWFDTTDDLRLGEFSVEDPSVGALRKAVEATHAKLQAADTRLRESGSSFNELNRMTSPHAMYYRVGEFKVVAESVLFPELEGLRSSVQRLEIKLVNGIRLDRGQEAYMFYKDGKESGREPFSVRFFCNNPTLPAVCLARRWGMLYLQ